MSSKTVMFCFNQIRKLTKHHAVVNLVHFHVQIGENFTQSMSSANVYPDRGVIRASSR